MNIHIQTNNPLLLAYRDLATVDGEPAYLRVLATALWSGDRCETNQSEAVRIWLELANMGDTDAMCSLGEHHMEAGNGDAARAWLTKAAEAGDVLARYRLMWLLSCSGSHAAELEAVGWALDGLRYGDADERAELCKWLPEALAMLSPDDLESVTSRRVLH